MARFTPTPMISPPESSRTHAPKGPPFPRATFSLAIATASRIAPTSDTGADGKGHAASQSGSLISAAVAMLACAMSLLLKPYSETRIRNASPNDPPVAGCHMTAPDPVS